MDRQLDDLLKHALTPKDQPDPGLKQNILKQVKEREPMGIRRGKMMKAAVIAAAVLSIGSITAFASWKYLTPSEVAEQMGNSRLAELFSNGKGKIINETQSYGGYTVTFLGIIPGENLSEYDAYFDKGRSVRPGRTYVVVSIENADGTPLPDEKEEAYADLEFFVSPLFAGYDPWNHNVVTMGGGYGEFVEDGVLYRILECDKVGKFTDRGLYLCVSEGSVVYQKAAYNYDNVTGEISRNEDFPGLNALFTLPVDAAEAGTETNGILPQSMDDSGQIIQENSAGTVQTMSPSETESAEPKSATINYSIDEQSDIVAESGESDFEMRQGEEIAAYAAGFEGLPYVWGMDDLKTGVDSSGFVCSVLAHFDIEVPRTSFGQGECGYEVAGIEEAWPGDLIFYDEPAHVAIYLGDGKIIHAMPGAGVVVSEADFDEIVMIRRVLNGK